jgi:hypothetical protein
LIIKVDCRIPAVALESAALVVILKLSNRINSGIPGTGLSITACVASGVTSRGEGPFRRMSRHRNPLAAGVSLDLSARRAGFDGRHQSCLLRMRFASGQKDPRVHQPMPCR